MTSFSTIDLDSQWGKKILMSKTLACRYLIHMTFERSPSRRGWHVTLWCSRPCNKCRRRFDDRARLRADTVNRKPYQQNVLFCRKRQVYPERKYERTFKKQEVWK